MSFAVASAAAQNPVLKSLSDQYWRVMKCEYFFDGGTTRAILAGADGKKMMIENRVIDFGQKSSVTSVRMLSDKKPLVVAKSEDLEILLKVVTRACEHSDLSSRSEEFTNRALDVMTRSLKRRVRETQ